MKQSLARFNAAVIGALVLFVLTIVANSLASRQPWVLSCYKCKTCNSSCILGIDPQGFVDAALANDPRVYIYTTNVRLRLARAVEIDPDMIVIAGGKRVAAHAALEDMRILPETEVVTYRVQARNAAQFCIKCGACERSCVLGLPLLRLINQMRDQESPEARFSHGR